MPSLTFPPGLSARQKRIYAAAAICKPCCGGGSGSGSGSVSVEPGIPCPSGTCSGIEISTTLILSVNSIQLSTLLGDPPYSDDLARFVGDFTLTYLADEILTRDVDEFCEDTNVTTGSLWFSDLIDATDFSPPQYWRYVYDPCTGSLSFQSMSLDALGCYLEEYYARLNEPTITTLTISDCGYYADAAGPVFTGSVSAT